MSAKIAGSDPNNSRVTIARSLWFVRLPLFVERAVFSEEMVIVLGEAVGFVANVLEQTKREGPA